MKSYSTENSSDICLIFVFKNAQVLLRFDFLTIITFKMFNKIVIIKII